MNEEILVVPRDQIWDTVKIIRKGLEQSGDSKAKEDLEIWCYNMELELSSEENENLF